MNTRFSATYEEKVTFALRDLYANHGYSRYKMSRFEEYDLYVRNKDFLISDSVITFTDTNGKLMALKPDVTLSIIKSGKDSAGAVQKVYYDENVYRVSSGSHGYKEIMQVGLECIGDVDDYCLYETLLLAAKSLYLISDQSVLDLSHLGFITAVFDGLNIPADLRARALSLIAEKNLHELMALCKDAGLNEEQARKLKKLITLYGTPYAVLPKLKENFEGVADLSALTKLEELIALFDEETKKLLRIDFSVINDIHYYNGIVFKGFVKDVPTGVLSGGQYDRLLEKLGRKSGAIGFAVYLDALERMEVSAKYDVDVLLIYEKGESLSSIKLWAQELMSRGQSVQVQKEVPEKLRYKKLMKLEEGRMILLEERT
ncbi:MAG: ATP phosphoribosyltransferase regulatory subunit [Clostridia bacterium]|nr:ATP phosphoribosyltransferase regulatory subunit [Clostridia bacterium]